MAQPEAELEPEKEKIPRESCVAAVPESGESEGEGFVERGEEEEEEVSGDDNVFHQFTLSRALSEPSIHEFITPTRERQTRKTRRERKQTESLSERIQRVKVTEVACTGRKRKAASVNETVKVNAIVQYFNSTTTDTQANKKRKSVSTRTQDTGMSPTLGQDNRGDDVIEVGDGNGGENGAEMAMDTNGGESTLEETGKKPPEEKPSTSEEVRDETVGKSAEEIAKPSEQREAKNIEEKQKTNEKPFREEHEGRDRSIERVMEIMMRKMEETSRKTAEETSRKTEKMLELRDERAERRREEERKQEREARDRRERERERERKRDRETWEAGHQSLKTEISKMQQDRGNVMDEVGNLFKEEMKKMNAGMSTHQENQNLALKKHSAEIDRKVMKLESELSGLKELNTSITDHVGKISKNGGLHMGNTAQQHEDRDMVRMLRDANMVSRQRVLIQIPLKSFPHPWTEATGTWKDMRTSDKNTAIDALMKHIPSLKDYQGMAGRATGFTGGSLEKAMVDARRMGGPNRRGDLRNVQLTFASNGDADIISKEYSLIKEETEKRWDDLMKPHVEWIRKGRPNDKNIPPHPGKTILKVEEAIHPLTRSITGRDRALINEINAIRPAHMAHFGYDREKQVVYQRENGRKIERHLTDLAFAKAKADLMRQKKQNAESLGDLATGGWNTLQQYGGQSNHQQRQEMQSRGTFNHRPNRGQTSGNAGMHIRSQSFGQSGGQLTQEGNNYGRRMMRNMENFVGLETRQNQSENRQDVMADNGSDYDGF